MLGFIANCLGTSISRMNYSGCETWSSWVVESLAISISADKAEYISVRQLVPFIMKVTVFRLPVAHS